MEPITHDTPQPAAGSCKHCATGTAVPSSAHLPTCPNYLTPTQSYMIPPRCKECNVVNPKVGDHHAKDCSEYLPF